MEPYGSDRFELVLERVYESEQFVWVISLAGFFEPFGLLYKYTTLENEHRPS